METSTPFFYIPSLILNCLTRCWAYLVCLIFKDIYRWWAQQWLVDFWFMVVSGFLFLGLDGCRLLFRHFVLPYFSWMLSLTLWNIKWMSLWFFFLSISLQERFVELLCRGTGPPRLWVSTDWNPVRFRRPCLSFQPGTRRFPQDRRDFQLALVRRAHHRCLQRY